jgi:hypothetical protein
MKEGSSACLVSRPATKDVASPAGSDPGIGSEDSGSLSHLQRLQDLELEAASLAVLARRLSLALGVLLILSGILVTAVTEIALPGVLAPVGLLATGVSLIRFGGRVPDPSIMLARTGV